MVITWYLHARVNGSSGLDGGRRVSAVDLVRLGILSFAVDHGDPETQALGKRLGPARRGETNVFCFCRLSKDGAVENG